jgi:hypothetical protein
MFLPLAELAFSLRFHATLGIAKTRYHACILSEAEWSSEAERWSEAELRQEL